MKKELLKKYIPWIILSVIILSLSLWYVLSRRITQEQLDQYNEKVQQAQTLIDGKQYSAGIKKYYEAVDIIPKKVDAYEGIIEVLLTKNRVKDAQDVIEKSAKPLNVYDKSILYKMVGDEYYDMGEYGKAFDMYDSGLVLGVKNMGLELALGKVYLQKGNISGAKKQFQKSGFEGNEKLEANLLLSYIYAKDDISRAKSTLKSQKASEKMEIYYDEFSEVLNSLDEDKKYNASKLARIYINNGYPYLAISVLEPMKDEILEYLEGVYFLGRAYLEYGQYDKAIETLDMAISLGGMETDILWTKARAYYKKNDLDNTTKSYDGAVGYAGSELPQDLITEYIDILLKNNQTLKASELVRDLSSLQPELAYLNILAIKVNYILNEEAKIDYYLSKLEDLELSKTEEREYLQWKSRVLLDKGEDVDEYLVKLSNIDKYNPYYHLFLAKTQIKDKEEELAIQSLERALEYDLDYEVTEEASKLLSSLR